MITKIVKTNSSNYLFLMQDKNIVSTLDKPDKNSSRNKTKL